eukprot:CAMPEP_0176341084 /NCGR_PEP_ID=MMETSP0126-20121128/2080_1 /TAXON_ID=141414 ORGANISM="Strombidinopsis acuminatum, Strain SPMC142" /NCGR_SAMPLE_ID=MMETSP0126 /ASSEMBLY_ACC=CAM_ASM_000229 /LENGTH=85 /DNA_ID=CAMNT_0017685659 /DNA_START=271 /DNA_END=528 /DNA_ORIENTATION=+
MINWKIIVAIVTGKIADYSAVYPPIPSIYLLSAAPSTSSATMFSAAIFKGSFCSALDLEAVAIDPIVANVKILPTMICMTVLVFE